MEFSSKLAVEAESHSAFKAKGEWCLKTKRIKGCELLQESATEVKDLL